MGFLPGQLNPGPPLNSATDSAPALLDITDLAKPDPI
jgi:hypothetical protein